MGIDGQGGEFDRAPVGDIEGKDILFCQDLESGTLRTLFDSLKSSRTTWETVENSKASEKGLGEVEAERSLLFKIRNDFGGRWDQMRQSEIADDTLTDEQVTARIRWESIQSPETIIRRLQRVASIDDGERELDEDT